ncbi:carbon-nitrogen family hydrolase [Bacillus shivajii]|uniref:carbon-nitrogen family hydrolase n=1 Tax=Bacillus shivajii TaxID=1983719 RepID=UPI001CF99A74|nr:carbon-nitrogen family hydrolase [Bacillus shivajii]UCZ52029.1 carbon-nitrogen family hydrolase [Bacillus shivajii]
MKKARIALIQLDTAYGDPKQNIDRMKKHLVNLQNENIDLIVFPELWTTGYDLTSIQKKEFSQDEEDCYAFITKWAKKLKSYIVAGSMPVLKNNKLYNSSLVFDHTGNLVTSYDKAHLIPLLNEHLTFHPGSTRKSFNFLEETIGLSICYDIRYPEWIRPYAVDGASALVTPAQWPEKRIGHWKALLIARAIENQQYIFACNRFGTDEAGHFGGTSLIIDPWGTILAEGGKTEETIIADVDFDEVKRVRKELPALSGRRPHLYE